MVGKSASRIASRKQDNERNMTDPGERNLTRVPCERCSHCRSKKDEPVFCDGGFVECKPPVEPSLWLRAFYNFAANGEVKEPFIVSAIDGLLARRVAVPVPAGKPCTMLWIFSDGR